MSDIKAHIQRWVENKQRAAAYAKAFPGQEDWCMVFQFYAALHLTEAYLQTKPLLGTRVTHAKREMAIRASAELSRGFKNAYLGLKSLSRDVRYSPFFVADPKHFTEARRYLAVIAHELTPLLAKQGYHVLKPVLLASREIGTRRGQGAPPLTGSGGAQPT